MPPISSILQYNPFYYSIFYHQNSTNPPGFEDRMITENGDFMVTEVSADFMVTE